MELISDEESISQHHAVLEEAKPGDMIQYKRKYYSHWAIYIGNGKVIHRWGEGDGIENTQGLKTFFTFSGKQFNKATILETNFVDVLIGVERAKAALTQEGYNVIYNNCEHFATDCRYGQAISQQVKNAVVATSASSIVVAGVMFALGAFLRYYRTREDDEKDEKDEKQISLKAIKP
ncbi:unnamed protein product [Didymodactylos carnosus]|uniref:LRAT domain-containing protein n=1 Tax=Didymodactylos carnosus TaxID=1234261 RepID=A0A814B094_9BILA|nr:unnamed protein product [Didymodactylos carnosus]CAF0919236.1 unnamed protein product [Didymodactylos carnosus]CAF3621872.1 unnamed protein product [Didymodactylos carnosus]CAF3698845.1 unnamed protein product [Didymodactylos carnosus]